MVSVSRPTNWRHGRDHFYKYATANAAIALMNASQLRWSCPLNFDDPFDIGFDLRAEYRRDHVIRTICEKQWIAYAGLQPTDPQNELDSAMVEFRRRRPGLSRDDFGSVIGNYLAESLDEADANLTARRDFVMRYLRAAQVLCFSETHDNLQMWSHYSANHTGVVLRFTCMPECDSAWGMARQVHYQQNLPCLFDEEAVIQFLSGQHERQAMNVLEKCLLTKSENLRYEREWRVVRHDPNQEDVYSDIGFAATELTAIYLGCCIADDDRDAIEAAVNEKYPHAEMWEGLRSDEQFALEFVQVR